jgi:hypothetical protein
MMLFMDERAFGNASGLFCERSRLTLRVISSSNTGFAGDSNLNLDLLQQLGHARRRGLKLHLATVQEHERAALWTGRSTLEELLESAAQLPPLA